MSIATNLRSFKEFFRSGAIGGVLLILCVIISIVIANSGWGDGFTRILATELGAENKFVQLKYPLLLWINDGLMAIFFLLIGLEIKRECLGGELSSVKQAALPVFAALGGAIVPAIIYYSLNKGTEAANGWGIPMATDIAFALAVIALLGTRVPASLKIFLTALAIADDLIAIIVIAFFYSKDLHAGNLYYSAGLLTMMYIFNRLRIRSLWFYLVPGLFIWYFIHHSGIHATIAGVLIAIMIPVSKDSDDSPLERLEHLLSRPVNYIIMPLFALANTNIRFNIASIPTLTDGLGVGIICGLVIGKPIGITLLSWITVKLKWSVLPDEVTWWHIVGVGIVGGIGFTMSVFIALLSFDDPRLQAASKFAILFASACSGIAGFIVLYLLSKKIKPIVSSQ
jgi:NhaA family Na+:H+ antiporter